MIPQAMKLNPSFFKIVYTDLLNNKKTTETVQGALTAIDNYLADRASQLFGPVIDHLREVGEARSATEIDDHFHRNFDIGGVTGTCEYLADQGLIGKASLPVHLTKKSNIDVQELAFFHRSTSPTDEELPVSGKAAPPKSRPTARTTIAVQGARVHNLKNISVEIPRDRLIVVTGLSGSGKSSLAFDTIYAEGQRRYMESLSSYAKRFVAQVAKPDVDFVFGLSPVISIEQKTIASNPRSTVGTMTDIASYLNLLFATIGRAALPAHRRAAPSQPASQILEAILSLPEGTEIELRAPVFKVYGEELDFVFTEVRKKGCRRLIIDGKPVDISAEVDLDEDRTSATWTRSSTASSSAASTRRRSRPAIAATLLVGDGLLQVQVVKGATKAEAERFYKALCSTTHHFVYGDIEPEYFMFNNPESACRTCGGLGVHKLTHPELLVPDPKRSIVGGCFVREAFKYNPDTWDGRVMYSLSQGAAFLARHAVGEAARDGAPRDPLRHRGRKIALHDAAGREGEARRIGKARRSASTGSRGASSATTAATGSAARPARAWRRGSTR